MQDQILQNFNKSTHDEITSQVYDYLKLMLTGFNNSQEIDFTKQFIEIRLMEPFGKVRSYFFSVASDDLEKSLIELIEQSFKTKSHVFIGLALRDNNSSGKNSDCSLITFSVTDYDEVDGVKIKDLLTPSEKEAARQKILNILLDETDYPPTMIALSGNGVHAYHSFTSMIDVRKFSEQIKLKAKWLAERYSNCPGDPAMLRISQPIRLPGSCNFKDLNDVKLCKILEYFPERKYDFNDFPEAKTKSVPVKTNEKQSKSITIQSMSPFWECSFLNRMRENPNEQTYQLWFAAANTLAFFGEEGREAFHELSHRYPKYSAVESNDLFDKMLKSYSEGIGPITYEKIAEYGFEQSDDTNAASPAIYIQRLFNDRKLAELGIIFAGKKLIFNANIFADYFLEHYQLLIHEGKLFYEYQCGLWSPLQEYQMLREIRDTIQATRKNIYESWVGVEALTILKLAAPEAPLMETHKHLVNVANGMIDVNSFELLPHDPIYLSTVQIPLAYDPNAKCERFTQFLNEIMDEDLERIAVIQEFFGYLLTAETVIHKAFFLYGAGSNGKSILLDILTMLIGPENVSNLSLVDLDNSFRRSNLIGKTANIATENEINAKGFNSQYFKAIVSGDRIQVERKYENSLSYAPICKLVFAVNNLPYSPDKTHGLYRRMLIIPFDRRFDGKQADKHLKDKLVIELPGIFNWALMGLKRLRKHDYEFTKSAVINNAVSRYVQDQNPMLNYIDEMIEQAGPNDRVTKAAVLQGYYIWCRRNGLGDVVKTSPQKFWNNFRANCKELGVPFEQQTSDGIRYLKTLKLKELDDQAILEAFSLNQLP